MCTECMTEKIRDLTPADEHGWYWTLRAGYGVISQGLLICGPQTEVARFEFFVYDQADGAARPYRPDDRLEDVEFAQLVVIDAIDWIHFLPDYAAHLGKTDADYHDLLEQLQQGAIELLPRLETLMHKSAENWTD